eukprot:EG_transcript_10700
MARLEVGGIPKSSSAPTLSRCRGLSVLQQLGLERQLTRSGSAPGQPRPRQSSPGRLDAPLSLSFSWPRQRAISQKAVEPPPLPVVPDDFPAAFAVRFIDGVSEGDGSSPLPSPLHSCPAEVRLPLRKEVRFQLPHDDLALAPPPRAPLGMSPRARPKSPRKEGFTAETDSERPPQKVRFCGAAAVGLRKVKVHVNATFQAW